LDTPSYTCSQRRKMADLEIWPTSHVTLYMEPMSTQASEHPVGPTV